jgi:HSF-type DNA-binding
LFCRTIRFTKREKVDRSRTIKVQVRVVLRILSIISNIPKETFRVLLYNIYMVFSIFTNDHTDMTYQEGMVCDQNNFSHRIRFSNDDDSTHSSGTTVPHENLDEYSNYRKASISSTTKKLVFTSNLKMDDEAINDKENHANFFDRKCYDRDLLKPLNVSHNERQNKFSNNAVINNIGEYSDDCTDEDDDGDNNDLNSPSQLNANSLTPIPVDSRPALYPHQYHAARYGMYPQTFQQSQPYNGFYYSPPHIYPYASAVSQLQYVPFSSPQETNEQRCKPSSSKNTNMSNDAATQVTTGRHRGGVAEPFPEKLYRMLETCEQEGITDVVSFSVHGTTFAIHKPKRFTSEVMTRFFKQSKLTSFQRQLNLYGFKRISTGPDNGAYWVSDYKWIF